MKIRILGTRGEIEETLPYHSHHSGVLIDEQLMMDFGEKEFLKDRPKYIFITHLHPDHAYFTRNSGEELKTKVPIYAPEKYKKTKIIVPPILKPTKVGFYKITPVPTHHSLKVKSTAYIIEKRKEKILYTGDMIWINKEYHFLLEKLDVVITEGSFIKRGGMVRRKNNKIFGHNGIPDLVHLFSKFTKKIILVHFGSWFYKDTEKAKRRLEEIAKEKNIEIIPAYDGMIFESGNTKK